ncbi:MAG: hypothetical protein E2P02_06495 [Acidobacteria bacterium]|nr:MAG: hypothetical protein E2P02_06495 [Acidobacteriota bacterium]
MIGSDRRLVAAQLAEAGDTDRDRDDDKNDPERCRVRVRHDGERVHSGEQQPSGEKAQVNERRRKADARVIFTHPSLIPQRGFWRNPRRVDVDGRAAGRYTRSTTFGNGRIDAARYLSWLRAHGLGSNEYTRYLSRALARHGHDVQVLCREPHPADIPHVARAFAWDASGKSRQLFSRDVGDEGVTLHQLANGAVRPVYVTDKQRAGNVKAFESLTDDELSAYHAESVRLVDLVLGEHPSSSCTPTISCGSPAFLPTRRIRSSCFLTGALSSTPFAETTAIVATPR